MANIRSYYTSKPSGTIQSFNGTQELFLGEQLHQDPDGYYISTGGEIGVTQPHKKGVDFYMVHDSHSILPDNTNIREVGEYRLGQAVCLVQDKTLSGDRSRMLQALRVRSTDWNDLEVLVRRVKAGTITPSLSYQRSQLPPLLQFKDWFRDGLRLLKRDVFRFKTVF